MPQLLGELVARGTRSSIHAYGRGAVAKVPHPDTPDGWIRSEAEYADAARAVGAPVPRLLGLEQVSGRAASVWERIAGTSMWEHVVESRDSSIELGRLLADVQYALFQLVPPVTLPSQRDRIVSKIRSSAATVDASLVRALDVVPPTASERCLCHGDLHPSNVILSEAGPMIVDWFDASRGDPVADVARTCLVLLGDGEGGACHLPGSDGRTLAGLTAAYLARVREQLEIGDELLARWEAIQAVARMAEGIPRDRLMAIWKQFDEPEREPAVYAAAN